MLRVLNLAVLIGCLVFLCAAKGGRSSVGVFLSFDSTPGAASVEIMEEEAAKLLLPSGVSLDWRLVQQNRGDEAFARLVVLKFKGRCRVEGWSQAFSDFGTLGETRRLASTQVVAGRVMPYSEVECDEVRQALAYLSPGAGQKERQRALGLALGRVVAHEIYHILARTTGHAAHGLAKPSESLEDLVSPKDMPFQDSDSRSIAVTLRN